MKRFNWPLWLGLVVAFVAFISYFSVFSQIPATRDVPWATFLLFAIEVTLLVIGWRRAPRKMVPAIVITLGFLIIGTFTYYIAAGTKGLPNSPDAPAVGERAPEFTLADTDGHPVSLANTLAGANGALLVFYRGYW